MQELKDRILQEGKNLGGGILKVDGFINHQVDPALMDACGQEFARRFRDIGATKVLTAEISGIAPALTTAYHLGLPVVYARKSKPITMPDQVFLTLTPSHTKGRTVELIVSPEFLAGGERILLIDDFLASGATILGCLLAATALNARELEIYVSDAGNFQNPPWQILKFDENGDNPEVFITQNLAWPQDILFLEAQDQVLASRLPSVL